MACIDKETATAYVSGFLEGEEAELCAAHLAECGSCQALVQEVSELLDSTRRKLTMADEPGPDGVPPVETIHRLAASQKTRPRARLIALPARNPDGYPSGFARALSAVPRLNVPRWVIRAVLASSALILVAVLIHLLSSRNVLRAAEILNRASDASRNARTIPNRIVRCVWNDSLVNGYGPLPDGDYRDEYWWDNIQNRTVYLCRDHQGRLREGNWQLADGSYYVFRADDESKPKLTIGPADREVLAEIEQLPSDTRQDAREYFLKLRRPLYQAAQENQSRMEHELERLTASRSDHNSVHEITLPGGQRLYRVFSHAERANPGAAIAHWDVTRLIVDRTFMTMEIQLTGYRQDGRIYRRTRILTQEQVFVPEEADLSVFSPPSDLPAETTIERVTPKRRVELLRQTMQTAVAAR